MGKPTIAPILELSSIVHVADLVSDDLYNKGNTGMDDACTDP